MAWKLEGYLKDSLCVKVLSQSSLCSLSTAGVCWAVWEALGAHWGLPGSDRSTGSTLGLLQFVRSTGSTLQSTEICEEHWEHTGVFWAVWGALEHTGFCWRALVNEYKLLHSVTYLTFGVHLCCFMYIYSYTHEYSHTACSLWIYTSFPLPIHLLTDTCLFPFSYTVLHGLNYFWHMPSSKILGSQGSASSFLRTLHPDFHYGCTAPYSYCEQSFPFPYILDILRVNKTQGK